MSQEENILYDIQGDSFQVNPLVNMLKKIKKLFGFHSKVRFQVTDQRFILTVQDYVLWAVQSTKRTRVGDRSASNLGRGRNG